MLRSVYDSYAYTSHLLNLIVICLSRNRQEAFLDNIEKNLIQKIIGPLQQIQHSNTIKIKMIIVVADDDDESTSSDDDPAYFQQLHVTKLYAVL